MDGLVDWLKELAVFIVICETLLSFSPNGVYKRYIKPFVGLILLLRISAFLIGTVGTLLWGERWIGFLLFLIQLLSSALIGICFARKRTACFLYRLSKLRKYLSAGNRYSHTSRRPCRTLRQASLVGKHKQAARGGSEAFKR